jgi:tetratricopeptide (TPR) repeat protein
MASQTATLSAVTASQPDPAEIRVAVARMAGSDVFASSPQLIAFLTFVVDAALTGKSDRVKGYTIGVEVLHRDPSFDPQVDPIVRVEATRLRRTLDRYYAGPGRDEPIAIALPRGSYVPVFSWRATTEQASAPEPPPPGRTRAGSGMPVLAVQPIEIFNASIDQATSARLFYTKLCHAFARFDTIDIVAPWGDSRDGDRHEDYLLSGAVEHRGGTVLHMHLLLLDAVECTVVWSRDFVLPMEGDERSAAEDGIVTKTAAILLQPFGVIRAHQRSRHLATGEGDPRYRSIVEASESFRSFDPALHRQARASLERITASEPGFAMGWSYLAGIYFREHQYRFLGERRDPTLLDRALELARRAIELKPGSARGYQILFGVLFARHEIEAAFAAADRARALNPYDMTLLSDYGGRLVIIGEVECGMEMLKRAGAFGMVRPSWHHFYMCLGSYLLGDIANMRLHATQLAGANHPLALFARALSAAVTGDRDTARQALAALGKLHPAWNDDRRGELSRFFPNAALVDRIIDDLDRIE